MENQIVTLKKIRRLSPLDIPRLEKRKGQGVKRKLAELKTTTMTIIPDNNISSR